jgi:hypothetical protein
MPKTGYLLIFFVALYILVMSIDVAEEILSAEEQH